LHRWQPDELAKYVILTQVVHLNKFPENMQFLHETIAEEHNRHVLLI
jgi:hypothetical protein